MKIVPSFVSTHKYSWGFDLRIALTPRYRPLTKKGKSERLNTVKKRLHKGEMSLEGGKMTVESIPETFQGSNSQSLLDCVTNPDFNSVQ